MLKSIGYKFFIALLFTAMSITLTAQDDNYGNPQTGTDNERVQGDPFVPIAIKLAQSLQSRVNLDDDQMQEVRDILIQYNSKVRDLQGIQSAALRDNQRAGAKDKTGMGTGKGTSSTDRTGTSGTTAPTDRSGTSGTGTGSGNYGGSGSGSSTTGSNPGTVTTGRAGATSEEQHEIAQNLMENDEETNDDIEGVLNENQRSAWLNEKSSWWQEVKSEVYSPRTTNFDKDDMESGDINKNQRNNSDRDNKGTGSDYDKDRR